MRVFTFLKHSGICVIRLAVTCAVIDGQGMWHALVRREIHTAFWWGNLKEMDLFEDLGVDGRLM